MGKNIFVGNQHHSHFHGWPEIPLIVIVAFDKNCHFVLSLMSPAPSCYNPSGKPFAPLSMHTTKCSMQ